MSSVSVAPSALSSLLQIAGSHAKLSHLVQGNPEGNASGVYPDIDEAAHALQALFKGGSSAAFHEHAATQANLAHSGHHLQSQAFDPMAHSSHGLIGLGVGGGFVGVLGAAAMKAGWDEWKGSRKNTSLFQARDAQLAGEAAFVQGLAATNRAHLARNMRAVQTGAKLRHADNKSFMRTNKYNGLVGAFSLLSGLAIVSRVAVELARNLGGAVIAGTPNVHSAAEHKKLPSAFTTGTGLASNALAVAASAFAFGLGLAFIRKTKIMNEAWHKSASRLQLTRSEHIAEHSAYGKFIDAKSVQRKNFSHSFHVKNRMFLAGTALYAAGTIIPVCVKALAAAGILNSKKIDANIILALFATGIAGAIVMGLFSHQFFYGHPTSGRHEEHRLKDPVELGRRFMTNIDTFVLDTDNGDRGLAVKRGIAIRSAAFDQLQSVERRRESFLERIAGAVNRKFIHLAHVGDDDYDAHRPFASKLKAMIKGGQLRKKDVATWAAKPSNRPALQAMFKQFADTKIAFLAEKNTRLKEMEAQIMGGSKEGDVHYEQRRAFAAVTLGPLDETAKRLKDYTEISEAFGKPAAQLKPSEFHKHMSEFIERDDNPEPAGEDEKPEPAKPLFDQIAEHLLETMPKNYNHHRGCLLEMENQAAMQRHAVANPHIPISVR